MSVRKGIILAGGSGTRLYPMTQIITKQLQVIYDKPMIYYPLATLMLGGIRDILIISTPKDLPYFEQLLGSGSQWGITLSYQVQQRPEGIAQAFIIGEEFINEESVVLILGDNLFYGYYDFLRDALKKNTGATVFAYYVEDPERYGVVNYDRNGNVLSIIEKPASYVSNYAVTGLYIYNENVVEHTKSLRPSKRGELEITDLNQKYLEMGKLQVERLGRGIAWLDTGNPESLLDAAQFVASLEKRQGLKFGCPEETAYRMKFITDEQFNELIHNLPDCSYKKYLYKIYSEEKKSLE